MFHEVYLLLGSNLGKQHALLKEAIAALAKQTGNLVALSQCYETAAWGYTNQNAFLNQAVALHTQLEPENLLDCLLHIEKTMGRVRHQHWGERSIDIDILGYANRLVATDRLHIPHRLLHLRRFALLPLHDIAPQWIHPVWQQSVAQLLDNCPDQLSCRAVLSL